MKKIAKHNYKAGQLITFSKGSYSDYGYIGSFVLLKDLNEASMLKAKEKINQIVAECEKAWDDYHDGNLPETPSEWPSGPNAFIAALIREGYLMQIDMHEIHLGDSSDTVDFS